MMIRFENATVKISSVKIGKVVRHVDTEKFGHIMGFNDLTPGAARLIIQYDQNYTRFEKTEKLQFEDY